MKRDQLLVEALSYVYRTMVASVPLLEFAIPKSEGALRDYYVKHLDEERGHELMLADDLKRLGVDEIPRFFRAAMLAGSQYYLIAHEHPALLLGYMRACEQAKMSPEEVDELSESHGTPLTCLKHHAIHDPTHKQDLSAMIDSLPEDLKELVLWNERNVKAILNG